MVLEQNEGMNQKAGPREQNRHHSLGGHGVDYDATGVKWTDYPSLQSSE